MRSLREFYQPTISEGGAVGHLYHMYDNRDLTFNEIKMLLTSASEGKLERVSEKFDGQNCVFTWDVTNDELKVARSGGDIKRGGMDAKSLATKFAGRGNVSAAFDNAFTVLNQAVGSLPEATKKKIFGNSGNFWYSVEVIYTENPNVINYDSNNVLFHGWPVFEVHGENVTKTDDAKGVELLSQRIKQMQKAITLRNWKIRGPAMLQIKKLSDGSAVSNAISDIEQAQKSAGVGDDDTIGDYLFNVISDKAEAAGFSDDVNDAITNRVLQNPGAPTLNDIKKMISPKERESAVSFVKNGQQLLSQSILPIELAIHKFAVEFLKGVSSTLISKPSKEASRIRNELQTAISRIQASGNEAAMTIMKKQLEKLGDVGDIETSVEGVVFLYKGNAYKFTGNFSGINGILGLFKYGRGDIKPEDLGNV